MKFRCNLCIIDQANSGATAIYTVQANEWDDGMRAMQQHVDDFHEAGTVVVEDVTINMRLR